jgi:hypothetical protein
MSTKVGSRLDRMGKIANARLTGFSAAITDVADVAPTALSRHKRVAGCLAAHDGNECG